MLKDDLNFSTARLNVILEILPLDASYLKISKLRDQAERFVEQRGYYGVTTW